MASTVDTRPREVRKQAQQHADEARNRMDARRRQQDDGLTGWLNKRAGDWELSPADEPTMPVLVRGDQLSRALRLDKLLRLKVFPIAVSLPWGIAPAALPQFPLPAKIRTRLMPAVELDHNPKRADDDEYLEAKYWEVQNSIQRGMDALARKRALPLFG